LDSERSLHVALISQDFPPFAYGGIASSCSDLANALVSEGVAVDIFSGRRYASWKQLDKFFSTIDHGLSQMRGTEFESATQLDNGLKVNWFPKYGPAPRLSLLVNSSALVSSIAKAKVDVVHAFGPYGFLIDLVKKRTKKPVLSNIHSVPYRVFRTSIDSSPSTWSLGDFASDFLEYPASSMLMKTTFRKSDHIVFPSLNCLADALSSYHLPMDKVSVIIHGINFQSPYFKNSSIKSGEDSLSILYCGRLAWTKGIVPMIKAFSVLAERSADVTLKIVGGGPLESHARTLASNLGLQRRVHFLGALPREKAIQELRNATFLALPSLSENCPVVVCEAMSLAKPVVAFDFPFARALIENNHSGLLARPVDIRDFSSKMLSLLNDEDLRKRLGKNAYDYAREKFDWAKNVKEYIKIYTRLANSHIRNELK
jgi:glycosyltransferase involved in cell wall biosynthesis